MQHVGQMWGKFHGANSGTILAAFDWDLFHTKMHTTHKQRGHTSKGGTQTKRTHKLTGHRNKRGHTNKWNTQTKGTHEHIVQRTF